MTAVEQPVDAEVERTQRIRWVPRAKQAKVKQPPAPTPDKRQSGGRRRYGSASVEVREVEVQPDAAFTVQPPSVPSNAPPGTPITLPPPGASEPPHPTPQLAASPTSPVPLRAEQTAQHARRAMGAAVAGVGLAFVLNRLLGLVRDEIIAAKFGTSADLDAYYAAFRIPDFLFLVVASGAFGAAFIPVFTRFLERNEDDTAWVLASSMLNTVFCAIGVLSAFGVLFAGPLVTHLVAPGLTSEQQRLAADLTRILLLQPLFLGLGGAAMGILNAQQRFFLPALAPVTYNLGIIFGALLLVPHFGVKGLAFGVILGAIGHFLTQLPDLVRTMRYYPVLSLRVPGMREVGTLLVPRMFGQAVFALNFVIVTNFASRLGEGRVSGFQFGYTLFLLPHGVLALSAATVLFPTLARLAGARDWDGFHARYTETLRSVLFLIVPASAGLIVLRTAIPDAIYQIGAFTGTSTELTATALGALATGLIAYAVVEIVTRAFYALHDTRTPVIAGVVTIALNVPLSWWLSKQFGLGGLGLGLSLTTWLEMTILLVALRGRLPGSAFGIVSALTRICWATAAMIVVLMPCAWLLHKLHRPEGKSLPQLVFFVVTLGIGAAVYFTASTVLRIDEVERVRAMVLRRLGRGAG
jgi:putative peptidoglycan lipid II flippase